MKTKNYQHKKPHIIITLCITRINLESFNKQFMFFLIQIIIEIYKSNIQKIMI